MLGLAVVLAGLTLDAGRCTGSGILTGRTIWAASCASVSGSLPRSAADARCSPGGAEVLSGRARDTSRCDGGRIFATVTIVAES